MKSSAAAPASVHVVVAAALQQTLPQIVNNGAAANVLAYNSSPMLLQVSTLSTLNCCKQSYCYNACICNTGQALGAKYKAK
jgi:hypothetical protein